MNNGFDGAWDGCDVLGRLDGIGDGICDGKTVVGVTIVVGVDEVGFRNDTETEGSFADCASKDARTTMATIIAPNASATS